MPYRLTQLQQGRTWPACASLLSQCYFSRPLVSAPIFSQFLRVHEAAAAGLVTMRMEVEDRKMEVSE